MRADAAGRGSAHVVLAGGSTPRAAYAILARDLAAGGPPPRALHWWFGDERWVPVDDPQSNEGMARAALLGPLGAPEATVHSWRPGAGDPREAASAYAAAMDAAAPGGPDVTILGMGADGHTASLFPGSTACFPGGRTVPVSASLVGTAAAIAPSGARGWRLTLCPDRLVMSRRIVFLVAGADKGPALGRALAGDPATPAAWARGGETIVIADRAAAADLGGRTGGE